ncbi:hypothetical protein TCSYLVIO_003215 [Trypanosoma cruzi]|uniref:Uncharacterized protein n=1 Tax=Trypanosoma cruzi TaxID=5693 RepID=A0A2V2VJF0_TRYCR|nr:hypothetical protein TCSYLVIO_003215 [Trypanosoma cruzi]KAF8286165.1 hypothetical protein TcBrA4_0029360 [Trypanosoma cruzi]PBJ80787.1 hypothetical protein BCY84_00989 [Trypanosoma cruzi cruzi]PWU96559.1 hypothetical protein C4B63_18g46 [Trypanosoma cruzi]
MKGLEEWLASSSSLDDSNNADAVSAPPVRGGRGGEGTNSTDARTRNEEMRERMRNLLGDRVVKAVLEETSGVGKAAAPQSVSTADKYCVEEDGSRRGDRNHEKNSRGGSDRCIRPSSREYRRVEVMVVDRGTQTTSTVGCQTDPVENYAPYMGYPLTHCCTCSCGKRRPGGGLLPREEYSGEPPLRFKEQLDMIKNSIDIMIARYNLPPPPLPRVE